MLLKKIALNLSLMVTNSQI